MRRIGPAAALGLLFVLALAGAAYAYGAANHYSNGVKHGCPGDHGCYGSTNYYGDYNRAGYMRNDVAGVSASLYVVIRYIPSGALLTSNYCSNCEQNWQEWDTNPNPECDYRTWAAGTQPTVNGHYHYWPSRPVAQSDPKSWFGACQYGRNPPTVTASRSVLLRAAANGSAPWMGRGAAGEETPAAPLVGGMWSRGEGSFGPVSRRRAAPRS